MRLRSLVGRRYAVAALALMLSAAGAANAADKLKLAVLSEGIGGNAAAFIAKESGFFADQDIDLEIVKVNTPILINAALASGAVDIAISNVSAAFFNVAWNDDFVLLGASSFQRAGYEGDTLIVTPQGFRNGLRGAADLAGKRVGLSSLASPAPYTLFNLMQKYRVPLDSITLVQLGSSANSAAALTAGAVDAAISPHTRALLLETSGDAKIIAYMAAEVPNVGDLIFTSGKHFGARRDVLTRFMRAYLKAAKLYADTLQNRDEKGGFARTAEADRLLGIIAREGGVPAESFVEALPFIVPDAALDKAEIARQLAFWKGLGAVDKKVDGSNLVDVSILAAARGN